MSPAAAVFQQKGLFPAVKKLSINGPADLSGCPLCSCGFSEGAVLSTTSRPCMTGAPALCHSRHTEPLWLGFFVSSSYFTAT